MACHKTVSSDIDNTLPQVSAEAYVPGAGEPVRNQMKTLVERYQKQGEPNQSCQETFYYMPAFIRDCLTGP